MARIRTVYDIRFDPFAATQGTSTIVGEAQTVADTGLGFYGIRLYEAPFYESPSSVSISGYTEVSAAPAAGEFQVDYTYGTGYIKFNVANNAAAVTVNYKGKGSPVEAAITNEHRTAATLDHPDSSVTTAKIAANAVTAAKIASAAKEDVRQQDTLELRMEARTSDPSSPSNGRIWLRTDL